MVGQFEVSYSSFSVVLLHRGVPVGVIYAGNNVILRIFYGLEQHVDMVQSWSNFDDDGARPVPYLQLVSPANPCYCQVQMWLARGDHCHCEYEGIVTIRSQLNQSFFTWVKIKTLFYSFCTLLGHNYVAIITDVHCTRIIVGSP